MATAKTTTAETSTQEATDSDTKKAKTITLTAPDGRTYKTTDPAEAKHLNRTAGYAIKN